MIIDDEWGWIKNIDDGEQVNIQIKQIKEKSNGKGHYITGLVDDTNQFFMANISDEQAEELEGIEYAVMTCTGHQEGNDGRKYFYYSFDESCGDDAEDGTTVSPDKEDSSWMADGNIIYAFEELEDDLIDVLKKMNVSHLESFDLNYQWMKKVEEHIVDALVVIYRRKLMNGEV